MTICSYILVAFISALLTSSIYDICIRTAIEGIDIIRDNDLSFIFDCDSNIVDVIKTTEEKE